MTKIIYIAGLGHSGTTLLDLALGTSSNVVGLGELKRLMQNHTRDKNLKSVCSCGKRGNECRVWSELGSLLNTDEADIDKVGLVVDFLKEKYGKNVVLIDSSKNSYNYLKDVNRGFDLRLIYLTRDIRSWSYSRHLSTGKPFIYFVFRWVAENIKLHWSIKRMGIKIIQIGYEELAFHTKYMFETLSKSLQIEYREEMLHPENSNSHIISGNILRVDQNKRSGWYYDSRWMLSRRIFLWSPLLLVFYKLNRRLVYSNISRGNKKDYLIFGTRRKEQFHKEKN